MNLAQAIDFYIPRLEADANDISKTVRRVFAKKLGKFRGYDAIGDELANTILGQIEKITGGGLDAAQLDEVEDYINTRLDYIKGTFRGLNNPQKDKSDERADLVGRTEMNAAEQYGMTKGYEWSGQEVSKIWVTQDPCEECAENEEDGAIPVHEVFSSGDYAPPLHPNCRCYVEFIEDEDEE